MYIKSIEVECGAGDTLDSAIVEMKDIQKKYNADEVWCTFNTYRIDSNMSLDQAYLKVLGKTKSEFDEGQRTWHEEYDRKKKEYKDSIPGLTKVYIERARGIISSDKLNRWDEVVPIRLGDLYRGFELDCTLRLVKMLDIDDCTLEEAKAELESQGHSGMSYSLECAMLKKFCNRADEFLAYIDR